MTATARKQRKPKPSHGRVSMVSVRRIRPSPENNTLYRPVKKNDPDIIALAASIREYGIQEPLVLTTDHFIISGQGRDSYVLASVITDKKTGVKLGNFSPWKERNMTEAKCINLKERFSHRWKIEYEESHYADRGKHARTEDPWLQVIPCQNGHICPWGSDLLAACTNSRGTIAKRLKTLPFVTVVQDGDDGINATFHVDHFDEVAQIMRPRRRRPPQTEAQRRAAVENLARGKAYQFTAKNRPQIGLEAPAGPRRVSEHVRAAERPF